MNKIIVGNYYYYFQTSYKFFKIEILKNEETIMYRILEKNGEKIFDTYRYFDGNIIATNILTITSLLEINQVPICISHLFENRTKYVIKQKMLG